MTEREKIQNAKKLAELLRITISDEEIIAQQKNGNTNKVNCKRKNKTSSIEKREKRNEEYWDGVIRERTKVEKELNRGGFHEPFDY